MRAPKQLGHRAISISFNTDGLTETSGQMMSALDLADARTST